MDELTLEEQRDMWTHDSWPTYELELRQRNLGSCIEGEIVTDKPLIHNTKHLCEYVPDPVIYAHPLSTVRHGISFDEHLEIYRDRDSRWKPGIH